MQSIRSFHGVLVTFVKGRHWEIQRSDVNGAYYSRIVARVAHF